MPDPRWPRGAFARLGLVALFAVFFALPRLARAAAPCGSLQSTQALIVRIGGAQLAPANAAQAEFLRAALIAEPGADSAALYEGEARLAPLADGGLAAVYVVAGQACGLIVLGPGSAAVLAAIGHAPDAHVGDAL
jgi:hypothetical protein